MRYCLVGFIIVVHSETDLSDNEELYDKVYQEDDDEIYEDLCSTRRRRTHRERESVRMIVVLFYCKAIMLFINHNNSKILGHRKQ